MTFIYLILVNWYENVQTLFESEFQRVRYGTKFKVENGMKEINDVQRVNLKLLVHFDHDVVQKVLMNYTAYLFLVFIMVYIFKRFQT